MEWTKYTTKEALKDNDELMILDTDGRANKRTLMSKVWNYVVDKMTTAVIAKLGTANKTLIGAVNELNSNTPFSFSYKGGNSDKFYIKPSKPAQIIFVERGNGLVLIYFYPEQSDLILQNISGTIRSKIEYDTINKQFVVSNVQSTLYWILSNEKLKISSL